MKIDMLKNIKSFIYVDNADTDNMPYWYPVETVYTEDTYLEYLKTKDAVNGYQYDVKPILKFEYDTTPATDVTLYIGFVNSQIIDNIELDVTGTFANIEMQYSMDDWTYHFENYSRTAFDSLTNSNPEDKIMLHPINPIYLNRTLTNFHKPIEFKILKITFKSCTVINLNDIIIYKDENIQIPSETLNEFVYTTFQNDVLSIYKDTDIKDFISKYQTLMIEENQ